MTVEELRELLKDYPPDLPVLITSKYGHYSIDEVRRTHYLENHKGITNFEIVALCNNSLSR